MARPLITLSTDFGIADPYVGTMKGVIAGICRDAIVTDITHDVAAFDILSGALAIAAAAPFWPADALHIVVIDPGVGSSRRAIVARTSHGTFIAPDNGVLEFIYRRARDLAIRQIEDRDLCLPNISNTFHGRDVFAPVAAHLASGTGFSALGALIADPVRLDVPESSRIDAETISAHVLKIDRFGNLITDIDASLLRPDSFDLQLADRHIVKLASNYAEGSPGELFAIIGSTGFIEISSCRASAAELTGARPGDTFLLRARSTPGARD